MTKPTVYARYPSKRELAKAALMALGESRDRSAPEETGDTRRDLVAHLRHFQGGVGRPFGVSLVGEVIAEEHETPDLLALYREHIVLPRRQKIRRVLERARDGGELRDGADLDLAVNALVGAYYAQYLEGTPFPESWADSVVDAALEGLRRRAP